MNSAIVVRFDLKLPGIHIAELLIQMRKATGLRRFSPGNRVAAHGSGVAGPKFRGAKTGKFLQLLQEDDELIAVSITHIEIGMTKGEMLE